MSKLIAVTGTPNAGKTVFSLKLAQELQIASKKPVVFLSPDLTTPSLAVIFPLRRDKELKSMGELFQMTEVGTAEVLLKLVTSKSQPNLGYLGFMGHENKYSHPTPTGDKISAIFKALSEVVEYVIVDVPNETYNPMAQSALLNSDLTIFLAATDFKSIAYYSSRQTLIPEKQKRTLFILNQLHKNTYAPINEVAEYFTAFFHKPRLCMPYSVALEQQYYTGNLMEELRDKRYRKELQRLVKQVMKL